MSVFIIILIVFALGFDFLNGIHDSSNIVSTMIFSRAFPPRAALVTTALAEFAGPFIFGVAVAETIGNEIVTPSSVTLEVILAALLGAILWNLTTWYFGLPSSSSHAQRSGLNARRVERPPRASLLRRLAPRRIRSSSTFDWRKRY